MTAGSSDSGTTIKAFLIADVRGYTLFTQERGDEAAAKLAAKFAAVAREGVSARGGEVIELRGDEALAVFDSPRQAIRAALDLQDQFVEETLADPAIPLTVGMGLDAGEAVPVEGGYRGGALNLAARLCGQAGPGEVLASQEIVHLARRIDGVTYANRGQVSLKGMAEPVTVIRVSSTEADAAERLRPAIPLRPAPPGPGGPGPARPDGRRRRLLVGGLALLIVVAAVAIPLSLGQGGGKNTESPSPQESDVSPNSVGRLDLATGMVVGDTQLDSAPGEIAAGAGAIWATEPDQRAVVRIDPATGERNQTITVGFQPSGIAVGDGFVWVVNAGDPSVSRISPQTNQVVDTITDGVGNGPQAIAVDGDSAWVTNRIDGTVSRFRADSGKLAATIPLSDTPTGIAADDTGVWVAGPGTGTLQHIDPESNSVTGSVNVGNGPGPVASDGTSIWVANTLDGTVSRVDPKSETVTATLQVGDGPAAIAFSPGATWTTSQFSGALTRIDTKSQRSTEVHIGSEPRGADVSNGFLWFGAGAAATGHRGGTLEVIGDHVPDSIDPAVAYDVLPWYSLILVYDGLVGFKRVGGADGATVVPDLAVTLPDPTDGGLTYRFRLRDGITYSNGDPVRASDFGRNLERSFELPNTPAGYLYGGLEGASACRPGHHCNLSDAIQFDEDARTVTFRLAHPDSSFLYKLALPFAAAVPDDTPLHEATTTPIPGTGPYEIGSYRPGKELVLRRNPHFQEWSAAAQPDGFPDVIHWTFGPTDDQAVDAVESGKTDFMTADPPADRVQELVTRFAGQTHPYPKAATHFWAMNTTLPPFDDIRVRRAVNLATDRAALLATYGELGARVTCQDLPPNFQGYVPYCPYTSGDATSGQWTGPDMGAARKLLVDAGSPHTRVTVWIAKDFGPALVAQARYFTGLLTRLGLPTKAHVEPNVQAFVNHVYVAPSNVQFAFTGWIADYSAASNFLATQFTCDSIEYGTPGANQNATLLCDHDVDAKIHAAEAAERTDPQKAGELWAAADRAIVDQAPAVFVATPASLDFVSKRVANYQHSPQWGILLDKLWVR
jgi:peptide/nickel transport system substrate-binding protein